MRQLGIVGLLLSCFALNACMSMADIKTKELPADSAFLVLDADITFDGKPHALCDLTPFEGSNDLKVAALETKPRVWIMQVLKPGKTNIDGIKCHAYKVLWNKVRGKQITPGLIVDVAPGTITYPGTVVGTWDSEGMALKDLINGGGTMTEDEGNLVLKREDRSIEIRALLESKNAEWMNKFKFTTVKFEPESNIVQ